MDETFDYKKYIDDLAEKAVDEELTKHPERTHQREGLLEKKKEELSTQAEQKNSKTYEELQRAGVVLVRWIESLPPEEKKKVTAEITKINNSVLADGEIMQKFMTGDFNLQKLLDVDDSLIQQIYTMALGLQDKNQHLDAAALLKFLIILNPYVADFWIGLGFSYMHLHELEEAQTYLDTAIMMDTLNPRSYYFATLCSKLRKDTQKASNYCEMGLSLGVKEWDEPLATLKHSLGGQV